MLIYGNAHSWIKTPLTEHGISLAKRTGRFKLLDDGTLEGDVKIEYTGHQAISRREDSYQNSPTKRENEFKEEIKQRISTVEVSSFSIENFNDSAKPLIYAFKIRVPNYAQKTGKRLFFQPGFFEYGTSPVFSSVARTHSIFFPYPWSEQDDIEIALPKDFQLDNADSPGEVADSGKIGLLKINIGIIKDLNTLKYNRTFYFGGGSTILFPVSAYQPLKNLFDAFHKSDTHAITLKQN